MQRAGAAKRTVAEMALIRLCDTSLDSSADAILARLSKLETAVLSGSYRTVKPVAAPSEQGKVQPSAAAEKADEPSDKTAREEMPVASVTATEAEVTFRVLRGWNEIAEQATAGDGAILAFLKMAKAVVGSDGSVHIRFANDFAKGMVERADLR